VSDERGYLHGYTDEEADRLLAQAEVLAPYMLDSLELSGVRSLLEIGVGVGAETRLLRARYPEMRVLGVDISQASLERARRTLAGEAGDVRLVRASGAALPLAARSFDAALFMWVLEHVPDPVALLREAARCVKPGGRVIATEVYNQTLLIAPRQPIIEEYFDALGEAQRRAGGDPDLGPRLGTLALRAGLADVRLQPLPVFEDARDRPRALTLIRYFQGILRSAEPRVLAAGLFDPARLPDLWRAFDRACDSADAQLSYVAIRLEARAPHP